MQQGIGTLDEGKRIGVWTWYFENGQLQTERRWNNGKLIEIMSCYDGKGTVLDKGTLVNGTGTMLLYDSNGKLLETIVYKNGEIVK
ncbi:antitoxin component YwqK of YwqJK toxin-antitoxin module [Flavobacterium sp. 28A]|uniref:toxin-antitoxin system YwqK family antitoxin n=1 Tax=Flavobacterium sp. 28A TaxID=2735895 RepID=UPI001570607F|nr:antitoxin component YwqK of YwqJK toxin-antitoxin module [Flavobacterium sp. 28A]